MSKKCEVVMVDIFFRLHEYEIKQNCNKNKFEKLTSVLTKLSMLITR